MELLLNMHLHHQKFALLSAKLGDKSFPKLLNLLHLWLSPALLSIIARRSSWQRLDYHKTQMQGIWAPKGCREYECAA